MDNKNMVKVKVSTIWLPTLSAAIAYHVMSQLDSKAYREFESNFDYVYPSDFYGNEGHKYSEVMEFEAKEIATVDDVTYARIQWQGKLWWTTVVGD